MASVGDERMRVISTGRAKSGARVMRLVQEACLDVGVPAEWAQAAGRRALELMIEEELTLTWQT